MTDSNDSFPVPVGPNGLRLLTDPQLERIREHSQAFRRKGPDGRPLGWYGKIFDFILTAPIPSDEKWLFVILLLIGDKKTPTQAELAKIARMRPHNVSRILKALHERQMIVWDQLKVGHLNRKKLIHITDPYYWKGVYSSYNIPHFPKIKPNTWEPKLLDFEEGRINELHHFSEEDFGYVEAPRLIVEIGIPYQAKLVWLYLASICTFEHPTCEELSKKLDLDKKSVRKYLDILSDKKMILVHEFRTKGFGESSTIRIYHTLDVGLWEFPVAQSHYGKPIRSILYDAKITRVSSQGGNGTVTGGKRDCHRGETGLSQGGNGTVTGGKRDCHANSEEPAAQGVQGAKIACETSVCETSSTLETSGCVKQVGDTHPPVTSKVDISKELDPHHPALEYNLIAEVQKFVEPAFTYAYRNGKTHIWGPDSYSQILSLSASFIDAHSLDQLHNFGRWCQQVREKRGEKMLLENWDKLVKRWNAGENPEHPAVQEQMRRQAYFQSEEYQQAKREEEEKIRKMREEELEAIRQQEDLSKRLQERILALDYEEFVEQCRSTRKSRPSMFSRLADLGGNMEAALELAKKDTEFLSVLGSALLAMGITLEPGALFVARTPQVMFI